MSQLLLGLLTLAVQAPNAAKEIAETAATETVGAASEAIPAAPTAVSEGTFLLTSLFILVLPFVLAWVVAKALKVQEMTGRLAVVFFTLAIGASPFLTSLINGQPLLDRFRLGIDLAGGTNLVFQVKPEGKALTPELMDRMVDAVSQRINRTGTEEVTVRPVGRDRIEVIVPGKDPQSVQQTIRDITRLGSLEFFILADESDQDIVRDGLALDKSQTDVYQGDELVARWVQAYEENGVPKFLGDGISRRVEKIRDVNGRKEKYETEEYLLIVGDPEEQVTGKFLRSALTDIDSNGEIIVSFRFDQTGGFLFGQLTGRNLQQPGREPRKLAIVLDRRVFSAPQINSQITTNGQINGGSGGFTREAADDLTKVLNAGALEVPIDPQPLSEATVDPTLGADVRNRGVNATLISGIAVVVFMLAYYRFCGIIAVISLALNLLLTIAAMVVINATFTLPGIAGIVLTIGMAVDANVLIYERMREEIAKNSSVRMAIQNGFEKAFLTIFDANITTLITAVILFAIGTDQIKGFAVTLFLGLAISMYTVLFVGRLMFDISEKNRWLRKLSMSQLIGETKLDFLKHRVMWCGISIVIIGLGLVAFFIRGEKNYDIDFTGGTMVTFRTAEPQKRDDVEKLLKKEFKEEFTLERLAIGSKEQEGVGTYFRLRTTEKAPDGDGDNTTDAELLVRDKVTRAFADSEALKLRMVTMEAGEFTPFKTQEGDESAEALLLRRFDGGSSVQLTFSEEVSASTITDMFTRTLSEVKADNKPKYPLAADLFSIEGVEGPEATSRFEVGKFTKAVVRVTSTVVPDDFKTVIADMQKTMSSTPLFDEVNTFASSVADEMQQRAVLAIIVSILAISAYIWFRFQNVVFGLAAVVALVHDVLVSLGFVAFAGFINGTPIGDLLLIDDFRINLPMIAAFLTLVGYSLNDTIVMFDRIRELRGKNPAITIPMVNLALNQTLGRTILTATTVLIVVFILYAFGGAGIHGFSWCLLVGCIAGTYSSIYIASPILIWALDRAQGTAKIKA
ncbi:MAG: protein translocase subunit SecD [Planctomycetota bacterium]